MIGEGEGGQEAQAEGEEGEIALVGAGVAPAEPAFEDAAPGAEHEERRQLEGEEQPAHAGGVADATALPVEAVALVVAEALLLPHAAAVLGGAPPVGGQISEEQPALLDVTPPDRHQI